MSRHLKSEPLVQEWLNAFLYVVLTLDKSAYIDRALSDAAVARRARTALKNTPYRNLITKAKVSNARLALRDEWIRAEEREDRWRVANASVPVEVRDMAAPTSMPDGPIYTDEDRKLLWDMAAWATRQGFEKAP